MTNEEKFQSLLGSPSSDEKAFMLAVPSGTKNPIRLLSRALPNGGKVRIDGDKIFIKASEFTHADGVLLQVS